jgi:hypothetical protein
MQAYTITELIELVGIRQVSDQNRSNLKQDEDRGLCGHFAYFLTCVLIITHGTIFLTCV